MDPAGVAHDALVKVVLPLAAPGLFTAGILAFVNAWDEFLLALSLNASASMRTVPVGITLYQGEFAFPWPIISAALVVAIVPVADALDFAGFLAAYEDIIRKVKTNKLAVTDFQGATITLTNPGTIGTVQSVPRLMPGQGVIVGVGNIDYPAEFQGADQRALGSLGVSKVVTVTSTYDHRIVQGAESGMFLKRVHELLLGEHGFYDDVFR